MTGIQSKRGEIADKFGLVTKNEKGLRLIGFCMDNNMVFVNTVLIVPV